MIIAYSKLGRSWNLDPRRASTVGGDMDVIRLLMRLAWDNPEHTFLLVGRNSGENPRDLGYPDNVVNPWTEWSMPTLTYEGIKDGGREYVEEYLGHWDRMSRGVEVDKHIMWLGQHGGSNTPIPQIGTDWEHRNFTTPQMSFVNYCAYLLKFTRDTGVEPVLLCPDPRNYLKARELITLTSPILAQYNMRKQTKFDVHGAWEQDQRGIGGTETFVPTAPHLPGRREQSVWVSDVPYVYAAVELTALDEPPTIPCADTPGEHPFGLISNENRKEVGRLARLPLLKQWVLSKFPDAPLYGKWSSDSEAEIGRGPIPSVPTKQMYDVLRSFRSTITLPASGSGWATAKPWEAFASGTVMFFHPEYDAQGHVLPLAGIPHWSDGTECGEDARRLAAWLRVTNARDMWVKVEHLENDDQLWADITRVQRRYFEFAFKYWRGGARPVEEAVGLC